MRLAEVLGALPYPGRGCAAVNTVDDGLVLAYFVTGRSEASRARELVVAGSTVSVRATGVSAHDELRHYQAAALEGEWSVVGNGAHVPSVAAALAAGQGMAGALAPHECEPDGPIFTPRICLAARGAGREGAVFGYVRRRADGGMDRVAWHMSRLSVGHAVVLTTYDGTLEQVRASRCPSEATTQAAGAAELLAELWGLLGEGVRVGACALRPGSPAEALLINR